MAIVTKIEQISICADGVYMDIECIEDYVSITIGGTENEKFCVTLDEWNEIHKTVTKLLKQNDEKPNNK